MDRLLPAKARWQGVSLSISALPISTPVRSIERRRASYSTRAANRPLRGDEVAGAASVVAAIPEVRQALLALQRNFAAHPPASARGAVLDGRDIGTVICPQADVKLFITASTEARARRRVKELRQQGAAAIYEDVLQDLTLRDTRDSKRRAAPLAVAPDAKVIDTTVLDANIVFQCASELVARTLKEKEWQ